mgnify:CR=1 FL=1
MSLLDGLNEPQTQAVTSNAKHTLILAGAGSGKTRVLVSRIAFLMQEQGLSSQEILAVTFTNKAAGEMKTRLSQMLSIPLQGLWVGTFHGLCQRLLRRHFQEAHLPEQFYIIDSDDQARIIKRVIAELNLDAEQWPAKKAQFFINTNKDEGLRPQHVPAGYGPNKTWIKIYAAYEQACKTSGVVDFAEIILRTHELFRDNPGILNQYQERFKAVLVDEFQDTNAIQYAWICQLAGGRASVMAVGDDDQSIYGWRGAKIENIENFTKYFQNTQIIRLEQNYRSTGTILEASNNLIANNDARMGKELWTADTSGEKILRYNAVNEIDEARFVAGRIQMELDKGIKSDEIAILYRSNAQSRVLEEALLQANISYRIFGGMRFFDRAEVKDALAYLRLVVNANDDNAFERVVNFPTRGIGDKTLEEIRAYSKAHGTSLMTSAKELIQSQIMPQRASCSLSKFVQLIESLQTNTASLTLDLQLSQIIQNIKNFKIVLNNK